MLDRPVLRLEPRPTEESLRTIHPERRPLALSKTTIHQRLLALPVIRIPSSSIQRPNHRGSLGPLNKRLPLTFLFRKKDGF